MRTLLSLLCLAIALPAQTLTAEDFTGTREVRLIHGDLGSPKAKTVVITDKAKIEKLVATIKLEKKEPCACDHIEHAIFVKDKGDIRVSLCDHCFDIGKNTCRMPPEFYTLYLAYAQEAPSKPAEATRPVAGKAPKRPTSIVASLGKREVILDSGQHGLKYFPDECLAFVQTTPPIRVLMAAGVSTYLVEGRGMKSLIPRGQVLKPGKPGSFDNGYAGVGGVARDPASGELLAFYHAEDHEGLPPLPGGIPGFYCSVALAVSKDDGASFRKLGPAITGSLPKDLKGRPDQGCGDLCVVPDADHRYLYVYYCDHSRIGNRGVQICVARCSMEDAGRTDRWKKYYHGAFEQPGLGGKETPILSAQAMRADAIFPQVTFVRELHRYIIVFSIIVYQELGHGAEPEKSGIYIACSQDGIHWSKPTQLIRIQSIPTGLGGEIGWHPTLLLSSVAGGSAKGWLYYSYSESWGHQAPHKPHYLVGQPISFSAVEP